MVTATFMRIVSPCWKASVQGENSSTSKDEHGCSDGLLWHKDYGQHVNGEFSMAVIQANNLLEDYSRFESGPMSSLEAGPHGTFIGIYDGHGGPEAAQFVDDHLFENLKKFTTENGAMSAEVIDKAFLATEEQFLSLVRKQWQENPQIASAGACCLVGVICNGLVYIANAGDSRVVLGKLDSSDNSVKAIQLSSEHNASQESVREDLRRLHPQDPHIVVLKNQVWRVKGIIQVSRSIGDAYLKKAEFNKEPLLPKFRVPGGAFDKSILTAEPSILVQKLSPEDQFLIFASDGLWEHLSNQLAVHMVNTTPRNGIAKRLVKAAICTAAKKRETRYSDLEKIDRGVRRHFHDDISVVVLFLDSRLLNHSSCPGPLVSLRGAVRSPSYGNP